MLIFFYIKICLRDLTLFQTTKTLLNTKLMELGMLYKNCQYLNNLLCDHFTLKIINFLLDVLSPVRRSHHDGANDGKVLDLMNQSQGKLKGKGSSDNFPLLGDKGACCISGVSSWFLIKMMKGVVEDDGQVKQNR